MTNLTDFRLLFTQRTMDNWQRITNKWQIELNPNLELKFICTVYEFGSKFSIHLLNNKEAFGSD